MYKKNVDDDKKILLPGVLKTYPSDRQIRI